LRIRIQRSRGWGAASASDEGGETVRSVATHPRIVSIQAQPATATASLIVRDDRFPLGMGAT
jgi:hypothetical protein